MLARALQNLFKYAALLTLVGCASMFAQNSDSLTIHSEPEGAEVYFREQYLGKTPLTTSLSRRPEAPYLTFKKQGFATKNVSLSRTIDGTAFWNFGFITTTSGGTSWGVDALTGKMWRYTPENYVVKLEPSQASLWTEETFDYVLVNNKELRKDLSRREGETLDGLCRLLRSDSRQCSRLAQMMNKNDRWQKSTSTSLDLYREIKETYALL